MQSKQCGWCEQHWNSNILQRWNEVVVLMAGRMDGMVDGWNGWMDEMVDG